MENKFCIDCKTTKILSFFYKDKTQKDGYFHYCKECQRERVRKKRTRKRYKVNEYFYRYKRTDNDKNRENDLDKEFLSNAMKSICFYCEDIERIGLDRINNNIGHLKNNVVPCCYSCNVLRSNEFFHEEMILMGKVLKTIKENRKLKGNIIIPYNK